MSELRKLISLTPTAKAITIPRKYQDALNLNSGDYVAISMYDKETLLVKKLGRVPKP